MIAPKLRLRQTTFSSVTESQQYRVDPKIPCVKNLDLPELPEKIVDRFSATSQQQTLRRHARHP